jgi:hypothetical protein
MQWIECACELCVQPIDEVDGETFDGMCGQCYIHGCSPAVEAPQTDQ